MQAFALAWLAAVAQLSAGIPVAHGKEGETPACNKTAKNGISLHECIYGTDDTANGAPALRVDGRDEKAQRAFLSSDGCCINATTLCHLLPRASPSTSWKEERMLSPTNDRMCVLAIENTETFEAPGLVQSEDGDALLQRCRSCTAIGSSQHSPSFSSGGFAWVSELVNGSFRNYCVSGGCANRQNTKHDEISPEPMPFSHRTRPTIAEPSMCFETCARPSAGTGVARSAPPAASQPVSLPAFPPAPPQPPFRAPRAPRATTTQTDTTASTQEGQQKIANQLCPQNAEDSLDCELSSYMRDEAGSFVVCEWKPRKGGGRCVCNTIPLGCTKSDNTSVTWATPPWWAQPTATTSAMTTITTTTTTSVSTNVTATTTSTNTETAAIPTKHRTLYESRLGAAVSVAAFLAVALLVGIRRRKRRKLNPGMMDSTDDDDSDDELIALDYFVNLDDVSAVIPLTSDSNESNESHGSHSSSGSSTPNMDSEDNVGWQGAGSNGAWNNAVSTAGLPKLTSILHPNCTSSLARDAQLEVPLTQFDLKFRQIDVHAAAAAAAVAVSDVIPAHRLVDTGTRPGPVMRDQVDGGNAEFEEVAIVAALDDLIGTSRRPVFQPAVIETPFVETPRPAMLGFRAAVEEALAPPSYSGSPDFAADTHSERQPATNVKKEEEVVVVKSEEPLKVIARVKRGGSNDESRWPSWVLALGTKGRNEYCTKNNLSQADIDDIKRSSRRHKQKIAKNKYARYHRAKDKALKAKTFKAEAGTP